MHLNPAGIAEALAASWDLGAVDAARGSPLKYSHCPLTDMFPQTPAGKAARCGGKGAPLMDVLTNGRVSRQRGGLARCLCASHHRLVRLKYIKDKLYLYLLVHLSKAEKAMQNLSSLPDLLIRVSGDGAGPGISMTRWDPQEILVHLDGVIVDQGL